MSKSVTGEYENNPFNIGNDGKKDMGGPGGVMRQGTWRRAGR